MKKRLVSCMLVLAMAVSMFAGCGKKDDTTAKDDTKQEESKEDEEPVELIVFAAASMTETLTQLGDDYMKEHKNVTIQYNFDSSGTLKKQIQEGADCDIFISAGQKQMNQLDKDASADVNTEGLDFVLEGTAKLADGSIKMAMGNSDVPVGQYTQKILAYFGLNEDELAAAGAITYGSNVKEVTTQVSEAAVDCGIIYATDAYSANLKVVDTATKDMCGQVIYPAAVMKTTKNEEAAKAFLKYLTEDAANKVFEGVGFTPIV